MSGEHTAFFYGTLMAPEIFYSVCYGKVNPPKAFRDLHTLTPAILNDYCRHRVKHADYPGVVPEKGCSVRGVYATGLTDANVKKLDDFEGSEYARVKTQVQLLEKQGGKKQGGKEVAGEVKDTSVYVFRFPEELEKREWDFEEFRKEKMQLWTRRDWAYCDGVDDEDVVNGVVNGAV